MLETTNTWKICEECFGTGKKYRRPRKKARLLYKLACAAFEKSKGETPLPIRPISQPYLCITCKGSGLLASANPPQADTENLPHVAIIGGGIGGVALAVACLHRGIPFTLYERDNSFNDRSQGYGLTLQQATKAIEGLGIFYLAEGLVSTRHIVHTTHGEIIGEWGVRKWFGEKGNDYQRKTNIHIARQSLRQAMLQQLVSADSVQWGHQLINYRATMNDGIELTFQVNGETTTKRADLLVGADGIRSTVRRLLIGDDLTPLRYLGCIVILGICPLNALQGVESNLLDGSTVFQTANGHERIYMMPYSRDSVMWQLSFPLTEVEAKLLSGQGSVALKQEAIKRTPWHTPVPEIIAATDVKNISGYPVYDRAILEPSILQKSNNVTLIGDAAHPMSPFKGQGANQALLDALSLARGIAKGCRAGSQWKQFGLRACVLNEFEAEMLERSAVKVKSSEEAAQFLHSDIVLHEADEPRGRKLKSEQ